MRIVVDLGCLERGVADSLTTLAREYQPDRIYGFDPSSHLEEGKTKVEGVPVTLARKAAWVEDGTIMFHEDGSASRVASAYGHEVACFDFSRWLRRKVRDMKAETVVVKMDIEGAEYPVLERMIEDGTDKLVSELLVEWHGRPNGLQDRLRCPVREWWL